MPAAIDPVIKKQVVNQWLSGENKDRIADDNGIGNNITAVGFAKSSACECISNIP
jgi:hypothetical protein